MKRKFFILAFAACCLLSCQDGLWNAIDDLKGKYADLEGRVAKLEELCKEMNTNIASLQTLVSVILNNDYIVSVTPIMKEDQEIGYTITFAIHTPITIYYGKDGKDGKDGSTPIIGVAQDEVDHAYYWTLNGEWLLDVNGNRIPLTSRDGIDGKDGKDGQDGQNGITPQLKIENGYWYVSTDNGVTWTQLGKAVGENGQDGAPGKDGKDGEDGDSMFSSVTYDDDFVYFELANGTVLTVNRSKDDAVQIIDGTIMAEFSVSDSTKVYFSQGNLYTQDDSGETKYWFRDNQYGWGALFGTSLQSSYSVQNGGNHSNWRLLSADEWQYLMKNTTWCAVQVYIESHMLRGCVFFPNNYQPGPVIPTTIYTISTMLWEEWQKHGAVFLTDFSMYYWTSTWTSTSGGIYRSCIHYVPSSGLVIESILTGNSEGVRLVRDVE